MERALVPAIVTDSLDLRMKDSKLNEMSRWNDATTCYARDLVLRNQ